MGDNGQLKTPTNGSTIESHPQEKTTHGEKNLPKLIIPDSTTSYHEKPTEQTKPKNEITVKKKRRDKSDLGDDFVAPDGGWGWIVAIASGVNILVTFALGQQFGIVFRDHMETTLGMSSSELTTIINIQIAVSAITGLLNGPMFRRYSFRQVALVGSFLTFLGLFACAFANSFIFYVLSFSCCYGFGRGLTVSASSLAVNTYFKERRRTATAYQFGVAGLGPIVCPYIATFLLEFTDVKGTVLFFAALSLNTIACSLVYQPVKWHVKKLGQDAEALRKSSIIEHNEIIAQPVEPETPVLPKANDGWFGSRTSLHTPSIRNRLGSLERQNSNDEQMVEMKRLNSGENVNNNNTAAGKVRSFSVSHSIKEETNEDPDYDDHRHSSLTYDAMHFQELQKLREKEREETLIDEEEEKARRKQMPWYMKVVVFFDLDLLRDFTYVNLSMGLTLINFVEINFAILTPFILGDFGFNKSQIALAMSLLGFFDLVVRFLIPLITAKINLSNQAFFVVGILGMCIGRIILTFTRDFYTMIAIFIWLGLNKAFRTVFWSLIIPGYVPLKRLPAAAGLQLLMSGLFSLAFGPLIGLVKDYTNYAFALNFLNALCLLAIAGWVLESLVRKCRNKPNLGLK